MRRTLLVLGLVLVVATARAGDGGATPPEDPTALRDRIEAAADIALEPDRTSTAAPSPAAAPSAPAPPAAPLVPPEVLSAAHGATGAQLDAMGRTIAGMLEKTSDPAARAVLLASGAAVLEEEHRRESSPLEAARAAAPTAAPASAPAPRLSFEPGTALRQLVACDVLSTRAVGPPGDPASKSLARAAFEGVSDEEPLVVATPRRDHLLEGSLVRQPAKGGADLKVAPPPPPAPPVAEKGVRIAFDARALAAALDRGLDPEELEDRLAAVASGADLDATLAWTDAEVARRLLATRALPGATLVSLRRVVERARGVAWDQLPEDVRHPGGLRRIHALVLAPERDDVLVLGSTEGEGEPLALDDWSVAFDAVLARGATPVCSLEPDPTFGGEHRAVIQGVPFESHFAQVLLEADYAMKKILLGVQKVAAPALRTVPALLDATPDARFDAARFWFTPVQPGAGSIASSPDGRVLVFDARVQVLTEDMAVQGGALVGTGGRSEVALEAARSMTTSLAALEGEAPVLRQLHGLFDLVLAASLVRARGAKLHVLDELAALAPRTIPVPRTWAGVLVVAERAGRPISGGVDMGGSLSASSVVPVQGLGALARLEPGSAPPASLPFASPAPGAPGDVLGRAARAAGSGDLRAADTLLSRALERSPGEVSLLLARAGLRSRLLLPCLALRDLEAARSAGADAAAVRLLALRFRLDAGETLALDPADAEAIARVDLGVARATRARDPARALAALDRATRIAPALAEPALERAELLGQLGRVDEALATAEDVARRAPGDARAHLVRAQLLLDGRRFDDAIAATDAALAADPKASWAYVLRAKAKATRDPLANADALADAAKALALDSRNAGARVLRADLLVREGDREAALLETERAIQASPGFAAAHATRGWILLGFQFVRENGQEILGGNPTPATAEEALPELSKAVALDPRDAEARVFRATAYRLLATLGGPRRAGYLALARQDLEAALAVAPPGKKGEIQDRLLALGAEEKAR